MPLDWQPGPAHPKPKRAKKAKASAFERCAAKIAEALLDLERETRSDLTTIHGAGLTPEDRADWSVGPFRVPMYLREADKAAALFDGIRTAVRS